MRFLGLFLAALMSLAVPSAHAQMVSHQTGTTYTFQNADCDQSGVKAITFNNASGVTVTLPQAGANNQFLGGCTIQATNTGSGTVTITPTGSTINGQSSLSLTSGQSARIVNDAERAATGNYFALLGAGSGGGGGGNVSNTGTPASGQIAQWAGTTVIGAVPTTGSGSVVLATAPTLSAVTVSTSFNGWAPAVGLVPQGSSLVFGGTANAVGDSLTLNDGCSVHSKIVVHSVTGGAINSSGGYNIVNQGSCAVAPTNPVGVLSSTGSDTSATFTTAWAPTINGAGGGTNFILGTLNNNNGNTFITAFQSGVYSGTESVFVGYGTGGTVGSGSFNVAMGHNSVGIGGTGCPIIYVNSTTSIGTDALRNTCGNSQIVAVGASALKAYNQTGTAANFFGLGITAVGTSSMVNWNGAVAFPYVTAVGDSACAGQVGSSFSLGTCVGAVTGAALVDATNFLIIGGGKSNNGALGVGNTVFASGNGVILIGSGRQTVTTPSATTNAYINFENIWTVTGTNVPSSSVGTYAGSFNVVGTLSQGGVPVSTGGFAGVYGVSMSSTQTAATQGTGYVIGDTLTLVDGCGTNGVLTVRTVSGGLVTGYVVTSPGSCAAPPSNPVAVTGGTGTGATFNLTYGPLAAGLLTPVSTGNAENFWTGNNGPAAGFIGISTVLIGPQIGKTLTGASNFVTAVGYQSCGGTSTATLTMTGVSCFGQGAGKVLQGTVSVSGIDLFGSGSLTSQAQTTRNIAGFGASTFFNLNTSNAAANLAALGTAACQGASGATFSSGVCFGTQTGVALTSATNFLIIGPQVGRVTFASGTDMFLMGTGAATVDAPAAGTTHWMNINNVLLANSIKPAATSGFGTSPTVAGNGSLVFSITVGATGTPSSTMVVTFATGAPVGWGCHVTDETSVSSISIESVATSATVATWSSFSRTTGLATAPAANDVIRAECNGQ